MPTINNPKSIAREVENVDTARPAHNPIILPLLTCLTALGFKPPGDRLSSTGVLAFLEYDEEEKIGVFEVAVSRRIA